MYSLFDAGASFTMSPCCTISGTMPIIILMSLDIENDILVSKQVGSIYWHVLCAQQEVCEAAISITVVFVVVLWLEWFTVIVKRRSNHSSHLN